MSKTKIVDMQKNFEKIHGMLLKFIDVCPEDIWKSTFGGFPVWQQVFHALACYDFFVRAENQAPAALLFGAEEGDIVIFKKNPAAPSKDELKKAASKAQKFIDDFFASLKDDTALTAKHTGISSRINTEMSNLSMLTTLIGHGFYHLGSCDAALRQSGLEGVF